MRKVSWTNGLFVLSLSAGLSLLAAEATAQARAGAPVTRVRPQRTADAIQQTELTRLRSASKTPLRVSLQNGVVRSAVFQVPVPATAGTDQRARALWFLTQYRGALRLANPSVDLQLSRSSPDGDHLFFRRRHHGIPVFPGGIGVHLSGANVTGLAGNYVTDIDIGSTPGIKAARAESLAKEYDKSAAPEIIGDTSLRYVNLALLGFTDRSTHLAWRVNLTSHKTMYIDAHTGKLLYASAREMTDFDLELDNSNGNGPRSDWPCGGEEDWFDENGVIGGSPDAEGFAAFNNIKAVDGYFRGTFGRDAHDDDGEDIEIYVHTGDNWMNAHYISGCDLFEFGDSFATLDVMGHEFTHGVDENEAELEYCNESGALDESFADIFGHYIDSGDWLLGEGTPLASAPSSGVPGCTGTNAMRDLSNPPCHGDPDSYTSSLKKPSSNSPVLANDYGGVHTNSGINNKAAFLLTAGGTHNGRVVQGIGQSRAQQLFYAVHTAYLWDSSQMIDARDGAVFYAILWSSLQKKGFTASDLCQVRNAYAAVGLGKGDIDCDGAEDGTDADNDGDFTPNGSDNCANVANPGQYDKDGDGQGDECDSDIDGDKVANGTDNCDYTKNADQTDGDSDGKGDQCDDSDFDTVVDASDNCPNNANYNQLDADNDGKGDACDNDTDGDTVANAADNCPLVANGAQTDGDSDGIGNACDLCPGFASSDNTDTDEDGKANPCDADDDNDTVLDAVDNCPLVENKDQADLNGNGIGLKCDPEELKVFQKIENKVASMKTKGPLIIPVPICPACVGIVPVDFEQVLRVSAPAGADVRIVNSEGKTVARGHRGAAQRVLSFRPRAYSSSGDVARRAGADGMRYYLAVTPARAQADAVYEVTLQAQGALRRPFVKPTVTLKPAVENHQ